MLDLRSVRYPSLFFVGGNTFSRNYAFPLPPWFRLSLSSIFQGKKGTSDLIVFADDVYRTIINGLIHVIPPLLLRGNITPFKTSSASLPFPLRLHSIVEKVRLD